MKKVASVISSFMLVLMSAVYGLSLQPVYALGDEGDGGYPFWDAVDYDPANYSWGVDENNNGIIETSNDELRSDRLYYYRNCTDYVAWKIGTYGIDVGTHNGHGGQWGYNNPDKVKTTPRPGMAASWFTGSGSTDWGHVAFIEQVHDDGIITISEYNGAGDGNYRTRTGTTAALGITDFVDYGVDPDDVLPGSSSDSSGGAASGDGFKDDVLDVTGIDGIGWRVKYNGTSAWVQLSSSTVEKDELLVGDFDEDGTDDVMWAGGSGNGWKVKYGANTVWHTLSTNARTAETLLVGDFDGQ